MHAFIVHFVGEENKIAHSRLKDFVKLIGDGHSDLYFEFWGYREDGYIAKFELPDGLSLGEFTKACEICEIENGTLNSVH